MNQVVVVGGSGNVGSGIIKAFQDNKWLTKNIDPTVNKKIEELTKIELEKEISNVQHIVYASDVGNRDLYDENPDLAKKK